MTMTKPDSSPLETLNAPEVRPLVRSVVVYVVLWYSLYITAWVPTDPPLWALDWIEQLKPTFGALETAARLSEHPFPAQVMTLYAFFSTPLLGLYWVYYIVGVRHAVPIMYRNLCEGWGHRGIPVAMRLKLAAIGVTLLTTCWYVFPVHTLMGGGYWYNGYLSGWLLPSILSPSILSTTWFLFLSVAVAMASVLGLFGIFMALVRLHSPTSGRS
jgi:hypothetical protein